MDSLRYGYRYLGEMARKKGGLLVCWFDSFVVLYVEGIVWHAYSKV